MLQASNMGFTYKGDFKVIFSFYCIKKKFVETFLQISQGFLHIAYDEHRDWNT